MHRKAIKWRLAYCCQYPCKCDFLSYNKKHCKFYGIEKHQISFKRHWNCWHKQTTMKLNEIERTLNAIKTLALVKRFEGVCNKKVVNNEAPNTYRSL